MVLNSYYNLKSNWPVQKDIHGLPSRVILEEAKKSSLDEEELATINESTSTNLAVLDDSFSMLIYKM